MTGPRLETLVRPTDIWADKAYDRLGNDGLGLGSDQFDRIHQALGIPLEVVPTNPVSTTLIVGAAQYLLPDGQRQTIYSDGVIATMVSGAIDFATGLIVGGNVSGFALPTMPAANYVKALIEYEVDSDSLNVVFGSPSPVLASATVPVADVGYAAVCLVELYSAAGGVGVWNAIARTNLIKLLDFSPGSVDASGPREEVQLVSGVAKTVFNLVTFKIPSDRKKLKVEVNGVGEENTVTYSVTSDSQVTFVNSIPVNARVKFRIG